MRVHTITLDAFYLYLAMGPKRCLRSVSEGYEIPDLALWRRARRENWDGRIAGLGAELDRMSATSLARTCQQIWLARLVEALPRVGPLPGLEVGFTSMGTHLLVQLQRHGMPREAR